MSINSLYIRIAVAVTVATAAVACSTGNREDRLVEEAMHQAGDNAGELQRVIDHYGDDEKSIARYMIASTGGRYTRRGAGMDSIEALYRELTGPYTGQFDSARLARGMCYSSMPLTVTMDASTVTADYLTAHIDDAWQQWNKRKWNSGLPPELFCELLLPYRIGDEPLTSWREPYRIWLAVLEDTINQCQSSVDAAHIIASHIKSCRYNDRLSTPHRSAIDLLESPIGYCREDCDRTIYAMRSMGVPVAIDNILVSPENGASHQWTVVWDNIDRRMRMFDNGKYLPTRDSLHYDERRKGKVYRTTFAPDLDRLSRYREADNPPSALTNPWLKDVTAEYYGHNRAEVEIWPEAKISAHNTVYLGVFAGQRFNQVDIADLKGVKAIFTDIEPHLIYAPVTSDGNVCGYPFMLDSDGLVHSFIPDTERKRPISLSRKYPIRFHLKRRMESLVGIHLQSAPTVNGPWTDFSIINEIPTRSYNRVTIDHPLTGRYLRIFKPEGVRPEIANLSVCRDTLGLDIIPLSVAGSRTAAERYANLADQDILSWCSPETGAEDCIFRIDSTDDISAIFLVPHNDDNFVVPAQEYELLYFAGPEGWKSAGRKMSTGFSIDFEVPEGAVLWLRNLTKGREEQIFIWHDGRQLFNLDLYKNDLTAH